VASIWDGGTRLELVSDQSSISSTGLDGQKDDNSHLYPMSVTGFFGFSAQLIEVEIPKAFNNNRLQFY